MHAVRDISATPVMVVMKYYVESTPNVVMMKHVSTAVACQHVHLNAHLAANQLNVMETIIVPHVVV